MLDPELRKKLESISRKIRKKCIEIANSKNPNAIKQFSNLKIKDD